MTTTRSRLSCLSDYLNTESDYVNVLFKHSLSVVSGVTLLHQDKFLYTYLINQTKQVQGELQLTLVIEL